MVAGFAGFLLDLLDDAQAGDGETHPHARQEAVHHPRLVTRQTGERRVHSHACAPLMALLIIDY